MSGSSAKLRETLHVAGLDRQIEFAPERAAQLIHHLDGPIAPRLRHFALDQTSKVPEDPEIGVDFCHDARAADLQDHRGAACQLGPMHLCDRGCSVGSALQVAKHLKRRDPSACSTCGKSSSKGTGGTSLCNRVSSAVQAGGRMSSRVEHLAEFDEGRPEFLERESHPLLRFEIGDVTGFSPLQDCPARSSSVAVPVRRTRSPSPWRMRTELISRRRGRSRTAVNTD